MWVELDDEHTKCGICITIFSTDKGSTDENIWKHLPVLSSSQRCDHWFCHGCILREQQRVAEENNGRMPTWLKCMHCEEEKSFCPEAPKYHRLLIDLLSRAYENSDLAQVQVKEEQIYEPSLDKDCQQETKLQTNDRYPKTNHLCIKEEPGEDERPNAASFSTDQSPPTIHRSQSSEHGNTALDKDSSQATRGEVKDEGSKKKRDCAAIGTNCADTEEGEAEHQYASTAVEALVQVKKEPEESSTTETAILVKDGLNAGEEDLDATTLSPDETSPLNHNITFASETGEGNTQMKGDILMMCSICKVTTCKADLAVCSMTCEKAMIKAQRDAQKTCFVCKVEKMGEEFSNKQLTKGDSAVCKECTKALLNETRLCSGCAKEKRSVQYNKIEWAKGDAAVCKGCIINAEKMQRKLKRKHHLLNHEDADIEEIKHHQNASAAVEIPLQFNEEEQEEATAMRGNSKRANADHIDSRGAKRQKVSDTTAIATSLNGQVCAVDASTLWETEQPDKACNIYPLVHMEEETDEACNIYPVAQMEEETGVNDTTNIAVSVSEERVCPVCKEKKTKSSFFSSHLATQGDLAACKVCVKEQLEAERHTDTNEGENRMCYACKVAKSVKHDFTQIDLQWGQLAVCKKCTALQHTVKVVCSCCNTEKTREQFIKAHASKKVVGTAVCHTCIAENDGIVCFCCKKKKVKGSFSKDEQAKGDAAMCMKCFNSNQKLICFDCKVGKNRGDFAKTQLAKGEKARCKDCPPKCFCCRCKAYKAVTNFTKQQLKHNNSQCKDCLRYDYTNIGKGSAIHTTLKFKPSEHSDAILDQDSSQVTSMKDEYSKKRDFAAMDHHAYTEKASHQKVSTSAEISVQVKKEPEEDFATEKSFIVKEEAKAEDDYLDEDTISPDKTSPLNPASDSLQQGKESGEASDTQSKGGTLTCSACKVAKRKMNYSPNQEKKGDMARCKECVKAKSDQKAKIMCFVCKIEKPQRMFSKKQQAKDNSAVCKPCTTAQAKEKHLCSCCGEEKRRDHFMDKIQLAKGDTAMCAKCSNANQNIICFFCKVEKRKCDFTKVQLRKGGKFPACKDCREN